MRLVANTLDFHDTQTNNDRHNFNFMIVLANYINEREPYRKYDVNMFLLPNKSIINELHYMKSRVILREREISSFI